MNENLSNKLKKLLSLSKSATQAEAENALEKAVALAAKNNIDLATIAVEQPIQEEFVKDTYLDGKRICVVQRYISWLLECHFNVNVVYSGGRYSGRKIVFLGRKSDVEFALYVQSFLKEHMMRSWYYYKKSHNIPTRLRATYFQGFYEGLDKKLADSKANQVRESFDNIPESIRDESRNRYALMTQSENEKRGEFLKKMYPSLRHWSGSSTSVFDHSARGDGFNAGLTTNIARPLTGQLALN